MAEARAMDNLITTVTTHNVALETDDYGLHLKLRVSVPRPAIVWHLIKKNFKFLRVWLFNLLFPVGGLAMTAQAALLIYVVQHAPQDSWLRNGYIANLAWDISEALHVWSGVEMSLYTRIAVVTFWTSVAFSLVFAMFSRVLLQLLLGWHSPMYTPAKDVGPLVKAWGAAVKLLRGGFAPEWLLTPAHLYGYSSVMPTLPLPNLDTTVEKYLRSIRPLCDDAQFAEKERMAREFLSNEGPGLQRLLWLKWLVSTNYVTDWWEKYAYLRGRSSIMINSNYYALDRVAKPNTTIREARAATVAWMMLEYKHKKENLEIEPAVVRGLWPLCMEQHRRMFNTTRLPGRECDTIYHHGSEEQHTHIVVLCNGFYYKLDCYDSRIPSRRSLLPPHELERRLKMIADDAEHSRHSSEADGRVAALTAEERTSWAVTRETCMLQGNNRRSLATIDSAAFMLVLDDEAPDGQSERAVHLLAGTGSNRWFDKSMQLIVFKDARLGLNAEHSWADALVIAHMWELCVISKHSRDSPKGYTADGHCSTEGVRDVKPAKWWPTKLKWDIPRGGELETAIEQAFKKNRERIDDLDLRVISFNEYGKDKFKAMRMSPDSCIQMAMQLAYFRDQGKFGLTYEAAMTRLFRHGRTETVRSLSELSAAFVHAFENDEDDATVWAALQAAAADHAIKNKDAMTGKGVDRHLFGLYVVAAGREVDSPFLKDALSQHWVLSTSQQPQNQTPFHNPANPEDAKRVGQGGGFGPVADHGYGVSYMVVEKCLFFHVSSKKSADNTSSERFAAHICRALRDIGELGDRVAASQAKKGDAGGSKKTK